MAKQGLDARNAASELLLAVLYDQRLLSEVLDRRDGPLAKLAPADRARAQSLVTHCLRYMGRIDSILNRFLTKKPPLAVHNILRLCATELLIDGIAPHGAVDGAVNLAKSQKKTSHFAGLINAVARRIVREGPEIFAKQRAQELPKMFRKKLVNVYGRDAVTAIEMAHEMGAPVDITLKDASKSDHFAKALNADVLDNGSLRLISRAQISALDGFDAGDWWVQDAAAAMPARCLGDVTGKRVLDLCAAPGGKSLQLAAAGANVVALDISDMRMKRVRENLTRTKLNAELVIADALDWEGDGLFDVVLIDAPCSASGTVRRHPDLPYLNVEFDLSSLVDLQRQMIAQAAKWLKPEGELLFSTCSLFHEEGEAQAKWIINSELGLSQVELAPDTYGLPATGATKNGALRLRPDYWAEAGGMDGFFIAKFRKTS